MPPKNKKGGANNRDRRHENGLAPPAKQIKKQKSDGLLNGHADKAPTRSNPAALPVTAPDPYSLPASTENPRQASVDDEDVDGEDNLSGAMGSDHTAVFAALDSQQSAHSARDTPPSGSANGSHATYGADAGDTMPERLFQHADCPTTVIAPWSIVDIITILMVLMQLPSSVLTLVNLVFAFLTFGAPPAGWSTATVASASEWLQSHGGNPSLLTMVFLDIIFLGLWSLTPTWGKDIVLDFSQAVVAISLGGCSTGVQAKLNGIVSIVIICVYHLLGMDTAWRNVPLKIIAYGLSLLTSQTELGSLEYRDILDAFDIVPDVGRSWPRILLELHIVTQGIVRVLRRSLARTSVPRSSGKKPSGSADSTTGTSVVDASTEGARNTSSDGRQPGPSPATKDSRDKSISSGKKRRKQATFVRSQQPFWAAIASTKVTVSKEIEQSQSSRDSFEAGASSVEQLGSASNNCFDDSVWVSEIHDTEVWFSAVYFVLNDGQGGPSSKEQPGASSDSLVIRVNSTEWTQTSVIYGGQRDGKSVLTGKIFGLTPLSNYRIEFARADDDALLHSVNLLTRPHSSLEDQGMSSCVPRRRRNPELIFTSQAAPIESTFRPSSPMSTLRKSINAAETNLSEHRNRSKKTKKDHKSSTNALRREVDIIENRLSTFTGNDERQRQRQIQFRQNIKQAEDSAESMSAEISDLGEVPDEERQTASDSRANWKHMDKEHDSRREELDATRASRERQLATARAETTQQQQKHDRLGTRLNKLNIQRDGLLAAQAQDSHDQQQRDLSRLSELQTRAGTERNYTLNVQRLKNERAELSERQAHLEQQVLLLENGPAFSSDPHLPNSIRTPEVSFAAPAFGGLQRSATAAPPPGFGSMSPFAAPSQLGQPGSQLLSRRGSLMTKTGRGRSSSMLSNVSGFTDDEIGGEASHHFGMPPALNGAYANGVPHVGALTDRQGSTGSGGTPARMDEASVLGASTSRPDSRPATTSPKPKLSPIGAGRASPRGAGPGTGR